MSPEVGLEAGSRPISRVSAAGVLSLANESAENKHAKKAFQALIKTNKWMSLAGMGDFGGNGPGDKLGGINEDILDDFEDVYHWGKQIGIGTFSVVHECKELETSDVYAVKRIPRNDLWEEDAVALQDEISCLKLVVDCPCIVKLKEVFDEPDFTYMVLECLRGGYLIDKIIEKENYDEPDGLEVSRRLLTGIAYCHDQRIAIRDLKPESILLVSPFFVVAIVYALLYYNTSELIILWFSFPKTGWQQLYRSQDQ